MTRSYLQITDKKLMAMVFPLLFREAKAWAVLRDSLGGWKHMLW